jgi:hypothetical protein
MLLNGPARTGFLQQVQFDHITAAAGAQHGGGPEVAIFARDIELVSVQSIRKFLDVHIAVRLEFAPSEVMPPASRECNDLS